VSLRVRHNERVRDLVADLRADLTTANYTTDAVRSALGPVASSALVREQALPASRRLAARTDPVSVLARAFLLGQPTTRAELDGALPVCRTDGAAALGLVEASGAGPDDEVRPLLDVTPHSFVDSVGESSWWVVSDFSEMATGRPLPADHVLGLGGASTTLAQTTVRRPVGRVLDLGTGCGIQALHATRHADHVTATDVSERALRLAALNLELAGVGDVVDLRHGSLLEPVQDERFELVVSNPPFVITPRRPDVPRYQYRDGGLAGDELVRRLVTSVGEVLAPGGTAQLLGNWEVHEDSPWQERVGGWLEESGLDGWVVQREQQDPAEYAETWIRDGGVAPGPLFEQLYGAWLEDFEERGVIAVGFGLVTLRRPVDGSRPPLRRLEEQYGPVRWPLGEHLARCLDARDLLIRLDDAALLHSRWMIAADVTEERHHRPGEPKPSAIVLRQADGFCRAVKVGTTVAAAVGACDGELSLGQIADAVAVLLDTGEGEVREEVLGAVRNLAADAFLLPT
jgi:Methyltransferase small domain